MSNPVALIGPTKNLTLTWYIIVKGCRVQVTWYETNEGFGSLRVWAPQKILQWLGSTGLREVLPADLVEWWFDSFNINAGSSDRQNILRVTAETFVDLLVQNLRKKLAS